MAARQARWSPRTSSAREPEAVSAPGAPLVTVVVPTRDRPESLARCLAALDRQRAIGATTSQPAGGAELRTGGAVPTGGGEPTGGAAATAGSSAESSTRGGQLEVVVIDDQSRDSEVVRRVVEDARNATLIRGVGRGPAAARNLGASAAKAPIVCFIDDDCEPDPSWVAALAATMGAGADAVAGRTLNADPSDRLAEASQHIANYLGEHSRRGEAPFAASNNLACRTDLMRELPFDEDYPLAAGEDRAWCEALAAAGHRLVCAPEALIRHRQQLTPGSFWRQHVRYGRGAYRFGRTQPGALPSTPALYPRIVGSGFRFGPRVGALVCVAQAATAAGYMREAIAARRRR